MMADSKVYIVTAGCYSDYRIKAIFSTQELANEYVSLCQDLELNEIEEWELDNPIEFGYVVRVAMLRDGTVYSATKPRWCELPPPDAHWTKRNILVTREWLALLSMHVSTGTDELTPEVHRERAIKVTNEVRTRLLAMDKWPADGNPETIPFDAVAKARGEDINATT